MVVRRNKVLVYILFSILIVRSYGQENHYWIQQFGPTSTFLSGAVTGGVRDNSLIFYNPGAAAFTSEFNLSLQSNAIHTQNIYVRNGAGSGLNVHSYRFESIPQLFAFTYGKKDRPNWRTTFGWLTKTASNIRFNARNEVVGDLYSEFPGDEVYIGSWNYRNRIREDWFGFALTRRLGDKLGLGVSTFLTFRSYEYIESSDQNILKQSVVDPTIYETIRYVTITDNLEGAASGLLWKIGLAYEFEDYKIGASVTTPRLQVNFLSSMNYSSKAYSNAVGPDSSQNFPNYSILYDGATSTYHSPLIIDIGIMKNFFETDIYLRLGYFGKVPVYKMVVPTEESEISNTVYGQNESVGSPVIAQKEIWNFALGWNRLITEKFGMMAGFRTDFNYIDTEALEDVNGFSPEISYWNLYHVSAGSTFRILKHNFTLGLTYTYGRQNNAEQFINLDVPDGNSSDVFNKSQNTATAYVDQLALTIGYIYNFTNQ